VDRKLARSWLAALLVACAALSSGCATITGSDTQSISVATQDNGGPVSGAECRLTNNNGTWTVKTPGAAAVRRSAEDLLVRCEMQDHEAGTARVVSKVNAGMFGNILFGGAVGAVIDHSRGTAYDYPTMVRVVLGASRVIENGEISVSTLAPDAGPPRMSRPPGGATLDELDGLLKPK
jgi:hypothetical protein